MRPRVTGADPLASGPFSILGIRCSVAMSPGTRPSELRRPDPAPGSVSHPLQTCAPSICLPETLPCLCFHQKIRVASSPPSFQRDQYCSCSELTIR